MIFRLDLTTELADDLINYLGGLMTRNQFTHVSSIELGEEMFLIKYKKYIDRRPMIIWKGSKEYDIIMEWFKPKMRDFKLEELGI
jgi:hypothetical protein